MLQKIFLIIFGIVPLCIGVEGLANESTSLVPRIAFSFGISFILFLLFDAIEENKICR